jgi:hypothetical protein
MNCRPLYKKGEDAFAEIGSDGSISFITREPSKMEEPDNIRFRIKSNLRKHEIDTLALKLKYFALQLAEKSEIDGAKRIVSDEAAPALSAIRTICAEAITSDLTPCDDKGCEFCND